MTEGTALRAETPAASLVDTVAAAIDREERLIRGGLLPNMAADQHMKSWGEGARFVLNLLIEAAAHPLDRTAEEDRNG